MDGLTPILDGYDGLKLVLPNGRTVVGKVLPLPRAFWYRREVQREGTPAERLAVEETIIATFPKEVGLEMELHQLTVAEFWMVFWAFFGCRVPPQENGHPVPSPTGASS